MIFEFSGICQHCAAEVSTLVEKLVPAENCNECGEPPFVLKPIKGLVYVISNPHQLGVKVGMTQKSSIESRLKSLNRASGVPGKFTVVGLFVSKNPKRDEKKVHDKLSRFRLAKEHFDIDPVEALLKAHRALNRKVPMIPDPEIRELFNLKQEQARIAMQLRLRGQSGGAP